jgi:cytoskeleton protein RodZ
MTEAVDLADESGALVPSPLPEPVMSAGQMLRHAREASGMHIAALSVALKVPVRKLELLEADAYDQLPGTTFTRALAKSVCRVVKVDPEPVLALMPGRQEAGLDHAVIGGARRETFQPTPTPNKSSASLSKPMVIAAAALVLIAIAVVFMPSIDFGGLPTSPLTSSGAEPASVVSPPTAAVANPAIGLADTRAASPPASSDVPAAIAPTSAAAMPTAGATVGQRSPSAADASPAALVMRSTAPSWVEVRDSAGNVVFTGTVTPGVPANVDFKGAGLLVVGNAAVTEVLWRGRQLDVSAAARENVARLELK